MLTLVLLSLFFPTSIQFSQAGSPSVAQRLREINRAHDAALFPRNTPSLIDEMTAPSYLERFSREECMLPVPAPDVLTDPKLVTECNRRLKQALVNALASKYYAVNRRAVEERCKSEELACMDPRIMELWVRDSHNSEIERSRKEKLARIGRSH